MGVRDSAAPPAREQFSYSETGVDALNALVKLVGVSAYDTRSSISSTSTRRSPTRSSRATTSACAGAGAGAPAHAG